MSAAKPGVPGSLRGGLATQLRVMHALLMREIITRFGRRNLGVLWLVGEPMMFTAGVAALWSFAGMAHSSIMPIVPFAVTGYTSVLMWRNTVGRCSVALQQNLNLLYHRNVKVLDILVARAVLECVGAAASFAVLTAVLVAGGWMSMPEDFLEVAGGLALLAWFSIALGMAVGAAAGSSELVERIWHPLAYVLMPLSGAGFMADWLPPTARSWVLLLPMVHCTELLRDGYFGHVVRTWYDVPYVIAFNLCLTLAGLVLVRYASRRVEGL